MKRISSLMHRSSASASARAALRLFFRRPVLLLGLLLLPALGCNVPAAQAPTPSPVIVQVQVLPASGTASVTANQAPVRALPNFEAAVLATLVKDDQVLLVGISPDENWYLVQMMDGSQGWVSASFLSQTSMSTDVAAAVETMTQGTGAVETSVETELPVNPTSTPELAVVASPTGTPTPVAVFTPTALSSPTSSTAQATFIMNSRCRTGPGTVYDTATFFETSDVVTIEGRSDDSTWWYILRPDSQRHCWVSMITVEVSGPLDSLPKIKAPPTPTLVPVEKPTDTPTSAPTGIVQ